MLYPFWYVFMYSLSDPGRTVINNLFLVPSHFTLNAYKYVLSQPLIYSAYRNTLFITLAGTAVNLLVTSFMAYALSMDRVTGKKIVLKLLIFSMLFSGGLIPTYLVVRQFGLIDSLWSLIIPNALSVYYTLIMIRFFRSIPASLLESAKIDGCNDIYILFRIVLPLSTAAITAIGLFYAVGHWNEYLTAILYINKAQKNPLQVILYNMLTENIQARQAGMTDDALTPQSLKMSAVIVALAPIMMVYPFLQKHFMKGVLLGSVKG